jgi:hypothetical protein
MLARSSKTHLGNILIQEELGNILIQEEFKAKIQILFCHFIS